LGLTGIISLDSVTYNISSLPSGTSATIQFSTDGGSWYNKDMATGSESLSIGNNTIFISNYPVTTFYYKLVLTGDGTNTPLVDSIALNYTRPTNEYSWEPWKPVTSETIINSLDTDSANWSWDSLATYMPKTKSDSTIIKAEGAGSLKLTTGIPQVDANTVGLWHLDETGGTGAYLKDSSANANHGTPTGTTVVNGISGKGRSFNGNTDQIDTSLAISPAAYTTITMEAWIYPQTQATTNYHSILAGDDGSYDRGVGLGGSSPYNYIIQSGNGSRDTGISPTLNKWSYISVIYESSQISLYVDGILRWQYGSGGVFGTSIQALQIAQDTACGNCRFKGTIDEVRISNVARSAEEIAESYRMGRDHYLNRTISSTDLSGKTSIPFYVAADRPGSYLTATAGESAFANYQPDGNTLGLWHLDELVGSTKTVTDTTTGFMRTFAAGTLSADTKTFNSDLTGSAYGGVALAKTFAGGQDFNLVTYWAHNYRGMGMVYGPTVTHTAINNYSADGNGTYWGALNTTGFPSGYSGTFYGQYHAPIAGGGAATTAYWLRHNRTGNTLSLQYSTTSATGPWTNVLAPISIAANNNVVIGMGEAGAAEVTPLSIVSLTYGTTVKDSSSYSNDGNAAGTTLTDGKIGKAKVFNGSSDYVYIPNKFEPTTATWSTWVKFNSFAQQAGANQHVMYQADGTGAHETRIFVDTSGKINWYVFNTSYVCQLISTSTLQLGQWYYISSQYGASGCKLYINGNLEASNVTTNGPGTGAIKFGLGNLNFNSTGYMNGAIDEVRVDNVARTADEIRQAYEVGLRSHPITIDFGAKVDGSGGAVTSSAVLTFTLDATYYGLPQKGSAVYAGDKIILRENYDGTEYIAQGTVSYITPSTGVVIISQWDASSTFPPSGYSVNSTVFKWQREYWNITEPLDTHLDAVTNLSLRLTDGNEGRTIYLDDLRSAGDYMSNPAGTAISSSTGNRYFQYRAILSSADEAVSPSLSTVSLDYVTNYPPNTPTLISPTNAATDQSLTPSLVTKTTDFELNYLRYRIEFCTNVQMTDNCQTFDQITLQTGSGWTGQDVQSNTAYSDNKEAIYTLSTPLSPSTTYYWHSYAIDPGGSNTLSSTQAIPHSFTTSALPTAPTDPYAEGVSNPNSVIDTTPEFSAIHNDPDADAANKYEIEVNTSNNFTGVVMWDSGAVGMSNLTSGTRSTDVSYSGTTIQLNGATYYWRIRFTDINGLVGAWSATQQFTTNTPPNVPMLVFPTADFSGTTLLPSFMTKAHDVNGDNLLFKLNICTNLGMTDNCQIIDQTQDPNGWNSSSYASDAVATYTFATPLTASTSYYWRSYAIDPGGSNIWSNTQDSISALTTINPPTGDSSCLIKESRNDSSLTLEWKDNSTDEDGYTVKRSVDGTDYSIIAANLAADTNSYQDTTITDGHTYSYKIAPYYSVGPTYGDWCTTATLNVRRGTIKFRGF